MKEEFDILFAEHQKLLGELQAMRALAQPKQEPAAWPVEEQPDGSVIPVDPSEMTAEQLQRYTTPPYKGEEHMKLEWAQAPVKTQWGHDMVVASVAIDNDHTLDLYCERDQTQKVEAMLTQRTWVGLTEDDVCKNLLADGYNTEVEFMRAVHLVEATAKLLKEKNHD